MKRHRILRAIPGLRQLIKRAERAEQTRDKLENKVAALRAKMLTKDERIRELEGQIQHLVPANSSGAIDELRSGETETFAEVRIDSEVLQNPRFEKFPYAGPFPWLDQPDAAERIAEKQAEGIIDDREAELCRTWCRDGYLILERAIDSALLDESWAAYEAAIADGTVTLQPESAAPDDPWPGRLLNPHLKIPELCRILRHPTLLHWVELLMERTPAPFQTITSHKGSQQGAHSDSIHMTTYPIGYLSACWVAFEDIHPDSGPLVYYPGSHRLPYVFSHDVGIEEGECREGYGAYHDKYEPRIKEVLKEAGMEPHYFLAKKGDVLFWHANLIHGGAPRRNMRLSRRALVSHYFVEGAICYHDLIAANPLPYSGTCLLREANS